VSILDVLEPASMFILHCSISITRDFSVVMHVDIDSDLYN
jgi:hypothetical protein